MSFSEWGNKNMGKIRAILCLFLVLSGTLVVVLSEQTDGKVLKPLVYTFTEPRLETIVLNDVIYDKIIIDGTINYGSPNEPSLPIKGAAILIPPNTKVSEIIVTAGEKIGLGQGFNIIPAGSPCPIADEKKESISQGKGTLLENPFPGTLFTEVETYFFRGYGILILQLHPVHYIPATGEVYYYKDLTVSIKTMETSDSNPLFRGIYKDECEVIKKVDNPNVAKFYRNVKDSYSLLGDYDLLILTEENFTRSFRSLKIHHEANGIKTLIKSVSEIEKPEDPMDIRNYIKDAYLEYGIDYVLLGGDDDIVPAPQLWVSGYDEDKSSEYYETLMPSDLFYGCLDGPYNYDGDDKWGELHDGENGTDVDLMAEVYVGRACVGNEEEINNFITKTIEYMNSQTNGYLKNILMAAEELDAATYGAEYMDELIGQSNHSGYKTRGIPSDKFTVTKLYDRDWPEGNWPNTELINHINSGVHIINHLGHSNYQYALKMGPEDIDFFTNKKYCFIYSQGCNAGGFDVGDCMAEILTVKSEYGAFAAIMNARYGFYWHNSTDGDNQHYMREFWDAVFTENIPIISKANQDSKEDNLYLIDGSMMRWCYYQLNLFGDPVVALHVSNPPNTPLSPMGETKIEEGNFYTYTTSTEDIDGDQIYYIWDWGDHSLSSWMGPYPSGTPINASHKWEIKGIYDVKVKAKDENGMESDWSNPLIVNVPKTPLGNLRWIIEKIFEWLFIFLDHAILK